MKSDELCSRIAMQVQRESALDFRTVILLKEITMWQFPLQVFDAVDRDLRSVAASGCGMFDRRRADIHWGILGLQCPVTAEHASQTAAGDVQKHAGSPWLHPAS